MLGGCLGSLFMWLFQGSCMRLWSLWTLQVIGNIGLTLGALMYLGVALAVDSNVTLVSGPPVVFFARFFFGIWVGLLSQQNFGACVCLTPTPLKPEQWTRLQLMVMIGFGLGLQIPSVAQWLNLYPEDSAHFS